MLHGVIQQGCQEEQIIIPNGSFQKLTVLYYLPMKNSWHNMENKAPLIRTHAVH